MNTMSKASDRALELYMNQAYSCSESVFIALAEVDGLTQEEIDYGNHYAGAFSGGMGAESVCGALTGGMLTLGRYFGRNMGEDRKTEMKDYSAALFNAFVEEFGAPDCSVLKHEPDAKARCAQYVRFVVETLEEYLDNGLPGAEDDCG
jgi:C_GCAxxG_C_C family probable redox protein